MMFTIIHHTYKWPNSCAIVKAALNPLSSLMAQLRGESHIVPSSAKPEIYEIGVYG